MSALPNIRKVGVISVVFAWERPSMAHHQKLTQKTKKKRREDALEWARLVYKMYKEDKRNAKVILEHNNAHTPKS